MSYISALIRMQLFCKQPALWRKQWVIFVEKYSQVRKTTHSISLSYLGKPITMSHKLNIFNQEPLDTRFSGNVSYD